MLGTAGSDRFLLVLPDSRPAPKRRMHFLARASAALREVAGGIMRLAWASTENLGDWTIVRKRLQENLREGEHPSPVEPDFFEPCMPSGPGPDIDSARSAGRQAMAGASISRR